MTTSHDHPAPVLAPLEFAVPPESQRYALWTDQPVNAVGFGIDGHRLGWAWWADEPRAAGWISDRSSVLSTAVAARAWTQHLDVLASTGLSPSAAIAGTLPAEVGAQLSEHSERMTLDKITARAGRPAPSFPSAAALAVEALGGQPVSGATLDAGLRGQVPMSDAMHSQVKNLDAALLNKPVPERMVATRATSLAAWPGEPEALIGQMLLERAYFPVRLGPIEPVEHDAVVHLAIPAGIPAIYTAPPGQPEQGYLILARGLTWQVVDAERAESGTWVLSADVLDQRTV